MHCASAIWPAVRSLSATAWLSGESLVHRQMTVIPYDWPVTVLRPSEEA